MGSGREGAQSRARIALLQLEETHMGKNSHLSLNQIKSLSSLAGNSISVILRL